jgi:hypothetical protein
MLVFSNGNFLEKETVLTSNLAGSGGSPVTNISGLTCTVENGDLFHDFSATDYYGNPITAGNRQQLVSFYNKETGWYEEAYIYNRSGNTITVMRKVPGNEYAGGGTGQVFAVIPAGTFVAPVLNARIMSKMVQNSLPFLLTQTGLNQQPGTPNLSVFRYGLGYNAQPLRQNSVAIGSFSRCMVSDGIGFGGYPMIPKDDEVRDAWQRFVGMECIISTSIMSPAGGIDWEASTNYKHGTVFKANPDDGMQYSLYCDSWEENQIEITTTAVEPSWTGIDYDYVDVDYEDPTDWTFSYAQSTDWEGNGLDIWFYPTNYNAATFYPSEIIFVCDNWDNVTTDAEVTVTIGADIVINNQPIDGITGAHQIKRWVLAYNKGVRDPDGFNIKLDTRATATRFEGRFLIKGFWIESMDNPPMG